MQQLNLGPVKPTALQLRQSNFRSWQLMTARLTPEQEA